MLRTQNTGRTKKAFLKGRRSFLFTGSPQWETGEKEKWGDNSGKNPVANRLAKSRGNGLGGGALKQKLRPFSRPEGNERESGFLRRKLSRFGLNLFRERNC